MFFLLFKKKKDGENESTETHVFLLAFLVLENGPNQITRIRVMQSSQRMTRRRGATRESQVTQRTHTDTSLGLEYSPCQCSYLSADAALRTMVSLALGTKERKGKKEGPDARPR